MPELRIGHGFDVHRLVTGRKLILGGVTIPFSHGLLGHSDADVLTHAIMDALLGACALPDIGRQFPPGDERFRDVNSLELLGQVVALLEQAGCRRIVNVDAVIMAEQPKLSPHVSDMQAALAAVLKIAPHQAGIKATTTEQLGFTGRGEGIAASAVCLIELNER